MQRVHGPIRILCAAEDAALRDRLRGLFRSRKVQVDLAPRLDRVAELFDRFEYDVFLMTSTLCRRDKGPALELVRLITVRSPVTQMLFLAAQGDLALALEFLTAGAYQYAVLPIGDAELRLLIDAALAHRPPDFEGIERKRTEEGDRFGELVGRSEAMRRVYRQVRQAASTDVPVLLVGETGTGKDLAAEAIHRQSDRHDGAFVPVHLGAFPTELAPGELFGHERGAFTGAMEQQAGRFEQAHNGTIFLDEIGTLDERTQVTLLRVIERKQLQRLGGRQRIAANARIIAATNEKLEDAVRRGTFRQDLYYRLDVFHIELPPVRERQGDVPLLVDHFMTRYARSFQKPLRAVSPECIQLLEAHDWPGNVRELKNVIQRAVLICPGDTVLPEHLPPRFLPRESAPSRVTFEIGTPLNEVEREMVIRVLAATNNNRTRAAELLGISRRALYNKIARFGLG